MLISQEQAMTRMHGADKALALQEQQPQLLWQPSWAHLLQQQQLPVELLVLASLQQLLHVIQVALMTHLLTDLIMHLHLLLLMKPSLWDPAEKLPLHPVDKGSEQSA